MSRRTFEHRNLQCQCPTSSAANGFIGWYRSRERNKDISTWGEQLCWEGRKQPSQALHGADKMCNAVDAALEKFSCAKGEPACSNLWWVFQRFRVSITEVVNWYTKKAQFWGGSETIFASTWMGYHTWTPQGGGRSPPRPQSVHRQAPLRRGSVV